MDKDLEHTIIGHINRNIILPGDITFNENSIVIDTNLMADRIFYVDDLIEDYINTLRNIGIKPVIKKQDTHIQLITINMNIMDFAGLLRLYQLL